MTFDCQYSTNERLTYKFVTVFIVTENRNELVTINLHRVAFWAQRKFPVGDS
jgi:hypothetical protein